MQRNIARWLEYVVINLFIFALAGALYLCYSFAGFCEPLRRALGDFTVTDLYYSDPVRAVTFPDNIVLVNIGHRSRYEIAQMVERVQAFHPRVIGFDILFSSKADTGNASLKAVFDRYSNYVVSIRGKFESREKGAASDTGLLREDSGYANLAGIDKEHATVRYFYPYYNGRAAFTTAIIKKYDPQLVVMLDSSRNDPCEIRYSGDESAFTTLGYTTLMKGSIDSSRLRDRIVLFGYLGDGQDGGSPLHCTVDEDRLFTPLNDRLAGRSYPDMYGVLVHANILRMMLNGEYITVVPAWGIWAFAFFISLLLVPVFCEWHHSKGIWYHSMGRLLQLGMCIFLLAASLLLYHFAHVKLEPLLPMMVVLLMMDFIMFYHLFRPLPSGDR